MGSLAAMLLVAMMFVPLRPAPSATDTHDPNAHLAFVQTAVFGGIDTQLIGDSITKGWPTSAAWPLYVGVGAVAFGIGGDTASQILWRLQDGELGNAHTYVVLAGTNDLYHLQATPAQTAAAVIAIVDYIRTQRPNAQVVLLGVLPFLDYQSKVAATNAILAGRADSHTAFYDFGSLFLTSGAVNTVLMPDGIHPNDTGYLLWTASLLPVLVGRFTPTARVTASPSTVVAGGTLSVSWSGVDNPSLHDWVSLVPHGGADTTRIYPVYINGSPFGTLAYPVPTTAVGNYEVRLFRNDSYTRLTISNVVAVTH